jgi:hypothetical protein
MRLFATEKMKNTPFWLSKFSAPLNRASKFVLDAFAYNCMQQKTADRTLRAIVTKHRGRAEFS